VIQHAANDTDIAVQSALPEARRRAPIERRTGRADCRTTRIERRSSGAAANSGGLAAETVGLGIAGPSRPRSAVQVLSVPSAPRSNITLDLLSIFGCFLAVHLVYFNGLHFTSYRTVTLFSAVVFLTFALSAAGVYQTKRLRGLRSELSKLVLCWLCAFAAIGLFAFLSKTAEEVSRFWLSASMIISLFMLVGLRVFRSTVFTVGKEVRSKNVVLYGSADRIDETLLDLSEASGSRVRVVGTFEHTPTLSRPGQVSRSHDDVAQKAIDFIESERRTGGAIEQVWLALPAHESRCVEELSERLSDSSVDVCVVADRYTDRLLDGEITRIGQTRVANVSDVSLSPAADQLKRVFDVVLGTVALLLLGIPMAIIAVLVKLESAGPAIFRQKRYGVDGQEIEVLKFRSMFVHDDQEVRQATKGDDRVTRVGRTLRRLSLDELPQLFNVLQGTMSLVGPRPHAVAHNEMWRHEIRGYMLRHKVRPGITGWAQVNGWRGETDTADKMEQRVMHDLEYIRSWSLWLDMKILFLTVFKGLHDQNAY